MSEAGAQSIAVMSWSMLLAGAGLSGFGLFRALGRYRGWRSAGADEQGDIVLGDGRLAAGQPLVLTPGPGAAASGADGEHRGSIAEITRKHCVIAVEGQGLVGQRASRKYHLAQASGGSESLMEYWPSPGAEATLSVTAASAIYRFTARIRDVKRTPKGLQLIVARPAILVRIQRRKHVRAGVSVPATFERIWSRQTSEVSRHDRALRTSPMLHGTVRNMSGGGLRAHLGGVLGLQEIDSLLRVYAPDAIVRIGLPLPALPEGGLLARVCTCGQAVTPGGLTAQAAFEFLPMPVWEQEIVIQHVFQYQREQLRAARTGRNDDQPGICQ